MYHNILMELGHLLILTIQPEYLLIAVININIIVAAAANHRIRRISSGCSIVTTIIGSGTPGFGNGLGTNAVLNSPYELLLILNDDMYVGDTTSLRHLS